ncbi:kelch repeat protein F3 [Lumpy skin disease virus]|uniref:Uncharacterized protein n=1 Tax=Lumpy skin disease virus TaxID=59509 RepID=A0A1B3B601_LSDV|nr:hypothetical protein LSDVgp022 [Lumpy skin disease virus NI-2490]AOE47598.1 hypothetical protein [Lumpy skin disease virus]AAK84983.1 LSDV022 hypothetical protein [Lumpy skin disease virus NI-2490]QEJ78567.1 hypothetical protein LSD-Kenya_022 [Lumpy skin disease virus]QTO65949.1 hypothetical protein [Lumpy skin disease virus]UJQ44203.1 hypothetical protein LSDVP10_00132 [Lumpy skin disease virus]
MDKKIYCGIVFGYRLLKKSIKEKAIKCVSFIRKSNMKKAISIERVTLLDGDGDGDGANDSNSDSDSNTVSSDDNDTKYNYNYKYKFTKRKTPHKVMYYINYDDSVSNDDVFL